MRRGVLQPAVEFVPRETDPHSGSRLLQLTSGTSIDRNIYCEVSYMDAGSRYIMFTRSHSPAGPHELWRADLQRGWSQPVLEGAEELRGAAVSSDQRWFCIALRRAQRPTTIARVEIATLRREMVVLKGAPTVRSLGSLAADGRTYIYGCALDWDRQRGAARFGIVRADLEGRTWAVIHEDPEICNPHPQIEPGRAEHYLIQHNRGCQFDEQGRVTVLTSGPGATLYVIDREGRKRELPVGRPHTPGVQGHQCWIGDTGEVLLTISVPNDWARRHGSLLGVRPGDQRARVVAAGHSFCHPNASRDGRFFVSDTREDGHPIVVGSVRSGRSRVLCISGASIGRPQYTHPHPYFSPDRRWVIFNSDRDGIPRPYAASVPDGLLEELEAG